MRQSLYRRDWKTYARQDKGARLRHAKNTITNTLFHISLYMTVEKKAANFFLSRQQLMLELWFVQ